MRPITFLVAVVAVACGGRPAPVLTPEAGERVRVTAPDLDVHRHTGLLVSVQRDSLTVDTLTVARASITRLEVQRGRKTNARTGAWIGALSLGLAGVGLGIGVCVQRIECEGDEWSAVIGVLGGVGALGGGLIGLGVGALIKTERWEEVPLDRLRVSFAPQRAGRFGLGLSVRF